MLEGVYLVRVHLSNFTVATRSAANPLHALSTDELDMVTMPVVSNRALVTSNTSVNVS